MSNVQQVGSHSFDTEVLQAEVPVLVDFYADWCKPCETHKPILESLALAESAGLNVVKVDIDQNPKLAWEYGVRSIPTLVLFRNGSVSATGTVVSTQDQLTELIEQPGIGAG